MRAVIIGLALLANGLGAQELPRLILKTNTTTLINPFKQAATLTADIRLAPRWSADLSGGAFLYGATFVEQRSDSYRGGRWRAGFKYLVRATDAHAFHLGLEAKYNDIRHLSYRTALRQGGQYQQILPVTRTVRTQGLAFRLGWHLYAGKRRRVVVEPYWGLGIMTHRVTRDLPPDAELLEGERGFNFEYESGRTRTPDMLLGIQVGWVLW